MKCWSRAKMKNNNNNKRKKKNLSETRFFTFGKIYHFLFSKQDTELFEHVPFVIDQFKNIYPPSSWCF